jgi:hypothetical protein
VQLGQLVLMELHLILVPLATLVQLEHQLLVPQALLGQLVLVVPAQLGRQSLAQQVLE